MPIYEYQCPACGHRFERLQKMSDEPVRICPSCGDEQVRKLVSQSAFILKGSGWYKDHYGLKKEGSTDKGGSEKGGSDKSAGESSPTPAAAPAAAPAAPASAPASTSTTTTPST